MQGPGCLPGEGLVPLTCVTPRDVKGVELMSHVGPVVVRPYICYICVQLVEAKVPEHAMRKMENSLMQVRYAWYNQPITNSFNLQGFTGVNNEFLRRIIAPQNPRPDFAKSFSKFQLCCRIALDCCKPLLRAAALL